jgi:hypothetical protein
MYNLQSSIGVRANKVVGDWRFDAVVSADLNGVYNVDQHHLRNDLGKDSFVIFQPYLGLNTELKAGYYFNHNVSIQTGVRYAYSANLLKPLFVNWADGSETSTYLNGSSRYELGLFANLVMDL